MAATKAPRYDPTRCIFAGEAPITERKDRDGNVVRAAGSYEGLFVEHPAVRGFGRPAGSVSFNRSLAAVMVEFSLDDPEGDKISDARAGAMMRHVQAELRKLDKGKAPKSTPARQIRRL